MKFYIGSYKILQIRFLLGLLSIVLLLSALFKLFLQYLPALEFLTKILLEFMQIIRLFRVDTLSWHPKEEEIKKVQKDKYLSFRIILSEQLDQIVQTKGKL